MITQIDVMSEDAFVLPILGITPKSSLLIKKITGLNPPARTLFIGDYSQDGGIYQGRRVGNRNVVITMDLNPNPALGETVDGLRKKLYKAFIDPQVDGEHLKMVLHDEDGKEIYFVGYCETFESEIFDSETMCQISMICPDPYLRDNQDTILTHETGWVQVPFTYEGTAETGFVTHIYVTATTSEITLADIPKAMYLVSPTTYGPGDLIMVNTIRGQRAITLTKAIDITDEITEFDPPTGYAMGHLVSYNTAVWRCTTWDLSGSTRWRDAPSKSNPNWEMVSTPIVSHLTPTSPWLELHSVNNILRVYEGTDATSIVANIKYLKYTAAYWGV